MVSILSRHSFGSSEDHVLFNGNLQSWANVWGSNWRKRHAVLRPGSISLYKGYEKKSSKQIEDMESSLVTLRIDGQFHVKKVNPLDGENFCFQVSGALINDIRRTSINLCVPTEELRGKWVSLLLERQKANSMKDRVPSNVRLLHDSVMVVDEEDNVEKTGSITKGGGQDGGNERLLNAFLKRNGWVYMKRGGRRILRKWWKHRFFVLGFDGILRIYHSANAVSDGANSLHEYNLKTTVYKVERGRDYKNEFILCTRKKGKYKKSLYMHTDTEMEAQSWMYTLNTELSKWEPLKKKEQSHQNHEYDSDSDSSRDSDYSDDDSIHVVQLYSNQEDGDQDYGSVRSQRKHLTKSYKSSGDLLESKSPSSKREIVEDQNIKRNKTIKTFKEKQDGNTNEKGSLSPSVIRDIGNTKFATVGAGKKFKTMTEKKKRSFSSSLPDQKEKSTNPLEQRHRQYSENQNYKAFLEAFEKRSSVLSELLKRSRVADISTIDFLFHKTNSSLSTNMFALQKRVIIEFMREAIQTCIPPLYRKQLNGLGNVLLENFDKLRNHDVAQGYKTDALDAFTLFLKAIASRDMQELFVSSGSLIARTTDALQTPEAKRVYKQLQNHFKHVYDFFTSQQVSLAIEAMHENRQKLSSVLASDVFAHSVGDISASLVSLLQSLQKDVADYRWKELHKYDAAKKNWKKITKKFNDERAPFETLIHKEIAKKSKLERKKRPSELKRTKHDTFRSLKNDPIAKILEEIEQYSISEQSAIDKYRQIIIPTNSPISLSCSLVLSPLFIPLVGVTILQESLSRRNFEKLGGFLLFCEMITIVITVLSSPLFVLFPLIGFVTVSPFFLNWNGFPTFCFVQIPSVIMIVYFFYNLFQKSFASQHIQHIAIGWYSLYTLYGLYALLYRIPIRLVKKKEMAQKVNLKNQNNKSYSTSSKNEIKDSVVQLSTDIPCDLCGTNVVQMACMRCDVKLCGKCDMQHHGANRLLKLHTRFQIHNDTFKPLLKNEKSGEKKRKAKYNIIAFVKSFVPLPLGVLTVSEILQLAIQILYIPALEKAFQQRKE
eukprot:g247.t1